MPQGLFSAAVNGVAVMGAGDGVGLGVGLGLGLGLGVGLGVGEGVGLGVGEGVGPLVGSGSPLLPPQPAASEPAATSSQASVVRLRVELCAFIVVRP